MKQRPSWVVNREHKPQCMRTKEGITQYIAKYIMHASHVSNSLYTKKGIHIPHLDDTKHSQGMLCITIKIQ